MPPQPTDGSSRLAASRNAAALRLFNGGKTREALDALNQAIAIAPTYPHSFFNRARVFDRLGLKPQAAADRRRARELAAAAGLSEQDLFQPPAPAAPPPRRPARPAPAGRPVPSVGATPPRALPRVALPRINLGPNALALLATLAGLAAIVTAILFVTRASPDSSLEFDSSEAGTTPQAAPSPEAATPAPTPAPSPATLSPDAGSGSPLSLSNLERAWSQEDVKATVHGPSQGFSGFSIVPVSVSLAGEEGSAQLSVFVYRNPEQAQQDWNLPQGDRPAPKSGLSLPSHETIWWNANVIVVVHSASGEVGEDAMKAFLDL